MLQNSILCTTPLPLRPMIVRLLLSISRLSFSMYLKMSPTLCDRFCELGWRGLPKGMTQTILENATSDSPWNNPPPPSPPQQSNYKTEGVTTKPRGITPYT